MPGFKGLKKLLNSGGLNSLLKPEPSPEEMANRIINFTHHRMGSMRWRIVGDQVNLEINHNSEYITLFSFIDDGLSTTTIPFNQGQLVYPHSILNEMPPQPVPSAVPQLYDHIGATESVDQDIQQIDATSQMYVFNGTSCRTPNDTYIGFAWSENLGGYIPRIEADEKSEESPPELPRGKRPLRKLRIKDE